MKKVTLILLNMFLVILVFQIGIASSEEVITLKFWNSFGFSERAVLEQLFAEYQAENPGIKIEEYNFSSKDQRTKILVGVETNDLPDILRSDYPFHLELGAMDHLLELDEYLKDWDGLNDISPVFWDAVKWNGKIVAVPQDMFTLAFFYNVNHFKDAGIEHFAQTWDEYVEMLKKLTKDTNGDGEVDQWGYTIRGTDPLWEFQSYLYQADGDYFDQDGKLRINDAAGLEAVTFYTDLYSKHKVMPPGTPSYGWNEAWDIWKEGKVSCYIGGTWTLGNIRALEEEKPWGFEYNVAKAPKGKKDATMIEECYYTVMKASQHQKEAVELIKWLVSKENDLKWCKELSHLPIRSSNLETIVSSDPIFKGFLESRKIAKIRPRIPYFWEFAAPLTSGLKEIFAGKKNPKQALDDTAVAMQAVIDKFNE